MRSPGFEPGIISLEGVRNGGNNENGGKNRWGSVEDLLAFKQFIAKRGYRGNYGSQLYNYGVKYADCLFTGDLRSVEALPSGRRPNALKGLSILAKSVHRYSYFKDLIENGQVKWGGRKKNLIFADRMKKLRDSEEFWSWVRLVKEKRCDLDDFMDFMAVSGLRLVEAVASYDLIGQCARGGGLDLKLRGEGKACERVSGYYNRSLGWLEHFWFPDIFLRDTKNAIVSFVPEDLVKRIGEAGQVLGSAASVQNKVRGCGGKLKVLRFKDFRKANASMMLGAGKLTPEEVDMLQGRVTVDVFMTNYFTPGFAQGLQARAYRGIAEIMEKVKL